jgi:hypothetical protein
MSKRSLVLDAIKMAGYHEDHRTAMRLYVEQPVSWKAYRDAWEKGRLAKLAGIRCTCPDCRQSTPRPPSVRPSAVEVRA